MSFFKNLLEQHVDYYPSDRPFVYICQNNGVTAVVRADVFDRELRKRRKTKKMAIATCGGVEGIRVCRNILPVFRFSNRKPSKPVDLRNGSIKELNQILDGCLIEKKDFEFQELHLFTDGSFISLNNNMEFYTKVVLPDRNAESVEYPGRSLEEIRKYLTEKK